MVAPILHNKKCIKNQPKGTQYYVKNWINSTSGSSLTLAHREGCIANDIISIPQLLHTISMIIN